MCYFITVAVHSDYEQLLREYLTPEYSVIQTGNPTFARFLPKLFRSFLITQGMCSCGLYSKPGNYENTYENIKKKIEKKMLKKKGIWSDAKIERAIKESISALKTNESGLNKALVNSLSKIVDKTDHMFLLIHWYSNNVENEHIEALEMRKMRKEDLENDYRIVEEDKMIEIKVNNIG